MWLKDSTASQVEHYRLDDWSANGVSNAEHRLLAINLALLNTPEGFPLSTMSPFSFLQISLCIPLKLMNMQEPLPKPPYA